MKKIHEIPFAIKQYSQLANKNTPISVDYQLMMALDLSLQKVG